MTHPETSSQADLPIEVLAERNGDAIVTAVANQFHQKLASLKIVPGRSFFSEDGSVSFWVQNENGAYGVNGTVNANGHITNITTTDINLSDAAV